MLIITGGMDDKGKRLPSTELFDSSNGQWYVCNDLPQPHSLLQSLIVDNILYLLGGINKDGASPAVFTAPLDTLSRHQLKWNTLQDTPWCDFAPVSIYGTHLLIVGGAKMIGVVTRRRVDNDNHNVLDKDNKTKDYKVHAWLIIYVQLHNTHTTLLPPSTK